MSSQLQRGYRFDDCFIDGAAFQVWKAGSVAPLEPKSFKVLLYLIENRGRMVSKEELFQSVWGETFVTDNALTRVVAQLRKALGDNAKQSRYVETVPTQGYRFIAAVEEVADGVPAVEAPTSAAPATAARKTQSPMVWALAALAVLLAGGTLAWFSSQRQAVATGGPVALESAPVQLTANPTLDAGPVFSPDGSSIAYASDRSGVFELYVRPAEPGGRERQITSDGMQNVQPTWSPDGKTIAYHSAAHNGIYVVPALGGFARRLTSFGSDPSWSPDGAWIAFRSGGLYSMVPTDAPPPATSRIWVAPASGGEPRQLTEPGKPEGLHGKPGWSAQGKVLFPAYRPPGVTDLWTVSPQGGRFEKVAAATTILAMPVLSADERTIYASCPTGGFDLGMSVCVTDPRTGTTTKLFAMGSSLPRDLSLSPDGRRLAFSLATMTSNLWVLPMTGDGNPAGAVAPLMKDTSIRNSLPAISPDGRMVAYHVRRRGSFSDIFVLKPDGDTDQLTTSPLADVMPSWTPDGSAVAYSSVRATGTEMRSISLRDGTESVLTKVPGWRTVLRLSPDARKVLYHRDVDNGRLSTFWMDMKTGETKQLTPDGESMGYPAWSRDGKWVALERTVGESSELGVVPTGGGVYRALTKQPGQHWPHSWSPDSRRVAIAALRNGTWNLWWVGLDGREERLTDYRSLATFVRYPEWSPKGDRIVFEYAEGKGNIYVLSLK